MSKIRFTDEQVKMLEKNKYVKKVSNKAITYTFEFKLNFVQLLESGIPAKRIFEDAGFPYEIIGKKRISSAKTRWRKAYYESDQLGLQDSRKRSLGRPTKKPLSLEEENEKLKAQLAYAQGVIEYLKKLD